VVLQEGKKINASVSMCTQKEVHRRVCECAMTKLCVCECECDEKLTEDLQPGKDFTVGLFGRVVNLEDLALWESRCKTVRGCLLFAQLER
jgi:hypothetical protein